MRGRPRRRELAYRIRHALLLVSCAANHWVAGHHPRNRWHDGLPSLYARNRSSAGTRSDFQPGWVVGNHEYPGAYSAPGSAGRSDSGAGSGAESHRRRPAGAQTLDVPFSVGVGIRAACFTRTIEVIAHGQAGGFSTPVRLPLGIDRSAAIAARLAAFELPAPGPWIVAGRPALSSPAGAPDPTPVQTGVVPGVAWPDPTWSDTSPVHKTRCPPRMKR